MKRRGCCEGGDFKVDEVDDGINQLTNPSANAQLAFLARLHVEQ